jgi:hypothetical protein
MTPTAKRSPLHTSDVPALFGVLSEDRPFVSSILRSRFRRAVPKALLLPFQVEKRHLRNVLSCMQLMDICGLSITGEHRRSILRFVSEVDPLARACRSVDTIVRRGNRFCGFCSWADALIHWILHGMPRSSLLPCIHTIGKGELLTMAHHALRCAGLPLARLSPSALQRRMPKTTTAVTPLVLIIGEITASQRQSSLLTSILSATRYNAVVDLRIRPNNLPLSRSVRRIDAKHMALLEVAHAVGFLTPENPLKP